MRVERVFPGLILAIGVAFGQAPPAFEVASVKPSPPMVFGPGRANFVGGPRTDAGRATWTNVPLRYFMMQAYGVTAWRIEGGPGWLESDNFDITGTFPTDTPKENIPLMLKSLLADRFKLVIHTETKEQPVYALLIAKTGSKLKPHDPANPGNGNRGGRGHLELHNVTLEQVGNSLYNELRRTVVNRSELTGTYDFVLDWTPADTPAEDPKANGPSILRQFRSSWD